MRQRHETSHYTGVAIALHWLMAVMLIALLGMGKFMERLPENDALTITLIQWHKSFGITVLLLLIARVAWRLTHRPPAEPDYLPRWQNLAASATHLLLYLLMFLIPLAGWVMVSASPLNIPTLLFNVVEWPHLAPFAESPQRELIAERAETAHGLMANVMIVALLLHIGAALKHRFIDRDDVLARMLPGRTDNEPGQARRSGLRHLGYTGLALAVIGGVWSIGGGDSEAPANLASNVSGQVSFVAMVGGDETPGSFGDVTIDARLGTDGGELNATVGTGTIESSNAQVASTLPDAEWFDANGFPQATFVSTTIEQTEPDNYTVTGDLTIKDIAHSVSFPLAVETGDDGSRRASGQFTIDRREYDVGMLSQPGDSTVGFDVIIEFAFPLD